MSVGVSSYAPVECALDTVAKPPSVALASAVQELVFIQLVVVGSILSSTYHADNLFRNA